MHILKLFIGVIILILLFTFSIYNSDSVSIYYYHWESTPLPMFIVMITAFFAGAMIAWIFEIFERFKLYKTIRKQKKRISELESGFRKEQKNTTGLNESSGRRQFEV